MNQLFRNLFTRTNYKFSTTENGRLSSFYFQDSNGVQGRYRREHRDGEAVIYQGHSMRLFVLDTSAFNQNEVRKIYDELIDGFQPAGYSLIPQDGYHVVEFMHPAKILHLSSGTVIRYDPDALAFNFDLLQAYQGNDSDWTLMPAPTRTRSRLSVVTNMQ